MYIASMHLETTNNKASVVQVDNDVFLFSYDTLIMRKDVNGNFQRYVNDSDIISQTTSSHIKKFSGLTKEKYFELEYITNLSK